MARSQMRKEAGLKINPETAEVDWVGRHSTIWRVPNFPRVPQVGREYFARAPGSDIWVWFIDLPEATETALWEKLKRKQVD